MKFRDLPYNQQNERRDEMVAELVAVEKWYPTLSEYDFMDAYHNAEKCMKEDGTTMGDFLDYYAASCGGIEESK